MACVENNIAVWQQDRVRGASVEGSANGRESFRSDSLVDRRPIGIPTGEFRAVGYADELYDGVTRGRIDTGKKQVSRILFDGKASNPVWLLNRFSIQKQRCRRAF